MLHTILAFPVPVSHPELLDAAPVGAITFYDPQLEAHFKADVYDGYTIDGNAYYDLAITHTWLNESWVQVNCDDQPFAIDVLALEQVEAVAS